MILLTVVGLRQRLILVSCWCWDDRLGGAGELNPSPGILGQHYPLNYILSIRTVGPNNGIALSMDPSEVIFPFYQYIELECQWLNMIFRKLSRQSLFLFRQSEDDWDFLKTSGL